MSSFFRRLCETKAVWALTENHTATLNKAQTAEKRPSLDEAQQQRWLMMVRDIHTEGSVHEKELKSKERD